MPPLASSACFLLSVGIISVCHYTRFTPCWGWSLECVYMLGKEDSSEPHLSPISHLISDLPFGSLFQVVSDAADQGVAITGNQTFNNWNWPNAMIFAATVITTIGKSPYTCSTPRSTCSLLRTLQESSFGNYKSSKSHTVSPWPF